MSEFISADEAAERVGVHPQTIRDYVRRGLLAAYRIPGARPVRYKAEDVDALFVQDGGGERE